MPFADRAAGAGDAGFVTGRALLGTDGSCFFGAVRGGLVFTSPASVVSSASARCSERKCDSIYGNSESSIRRAPLWLLS